MSASHDIQDMEHHLSEHVGCVLLEHPHPQPFSLEGHRRQAKPSEA